MLPTCSWTYQYAAVCRYNDCINVIEFKTNKADELRELLRCHPIDKTHMLHDMRITDSSFQHQFDRTEITGQNPTLENWKLEVQGQGL